MNECPYCNEQVATRDASECGPTEDKPCTCCGRDALVEDDE
jgi:hypothetical protein